MRNYLFNRRLALLAAQLLLLLASAECCFAANAPGSHPDAMAAHYETGDVSLPEEAIGATPMPLNEAILFALKQNLDLRAATHAAMSAAAALKGSYSLYDPVLSAGFVKGEHREQLNSFIVPATSASSEFNETTLSLVQKLPIGTELVLSGSIYEEDARPVPAINPSFDSEASLGLVQPLLKGFGLTVTNQQITLAARDRQISLQDLRQEAFEVVAKVRNAYFDTLRARYELSYRETSVELARRVVRENTARVEAGILPPVEKLEAEVGLQTRERFLLDAQRAFADALDSFNLLLNAGEAVYLPVIGPFNMSFAPSAADGIESGLLKRPDVLQRLERIEKIRTERSVAHNALLPELDLVASYRLNGLADDSGDAIDILRDGDYDGWEVGVRFSYPLGGIESRNQLKQKEISLMQERTLLAQLHNEVRNEVRAAIRNVEVSRKKTEAAGRGHELAREKLKILLKSREVGLATTRDVLDGEEDLASARTDQISSVAEYFKAVTEYLRVSGTLLESEGVVFEGDVAPDQERIPFYIR